MAPRKSPFGLELRAAELLAQVPDKKIVSTNHQKEVRFVADVQVGVVKNYFAKPGVAAIEVTDGEIQVGDVLWFKGYTTDFKQEVQSIEEERQAIPKAVKGQLVGVKVKERVRVKDLVYKVVE